MLKTARLLAAASLIICISHGAMAQGDPGYAKRLEAAKAYAQTMSSRQMVGDMLNEMVKNPQVGLSQTDVDSMKSSFDFDKMDKMVQEGLAKHFTEQELVELGKFYNSPTGQSILKKMPAYMSDVTPFIQQQVMTAVMTRMQQKAAMPKP
jgi:hypothetical protein